MKPANEGKPGKPPTKSPRRNQNKENTGITENAKSPPANKDSEGIAHRMISPVSEGVIRKVKSPVIVNQDKSPLIGSKDKDSPGAFQRVHSQEKDSGGAFKRVNSQDRDSGVGIKRANSSDRDTGVTVKHVNSADRDTGVGIKRGNSEEKQQSGAGLRESVGAKDSRRAVPAIGL